MGEAIWRGYDQEALDRQLNLRARTPEHADFFAKWAERGHTLRRDVADARLDVPYGDEPAEALDFFPAADATAPLVAFVHGGYWQSLDKADFAFPAPAMREAGVAWASLNYTLAPAAKIPQMVEQVRTALKMLWQRADDFGFDPNRIVVAGHSAGGHLAAMAALTDWAAHDAPSDLLKGCVSVSGIYELEPLRLSYQQPVLQLDPDQVAAASPLRLVADAGTAPPLLCAVGSTEPEEFRDQQREMLAAYAAAHLIAHEIPLEGRHHFDAVEALAEPDHALFRRTVALAKDGKAG